LPVSASIGVVERPVNETDPTDVMRAADISLHWAKADGKARWVAFDAGRDTREVARYALRAAMPAALDRGEFLLHYQPLINLATNGLRGVEALVRWQHPTLGLLYPDQFIRLAEDSDFIITLGAHLLEQACQQAEYWRTLSPHAPFVSVNLAARQIRQPTLVDQVLDVLDRTGLPTHHLQLELLESSIVSTDEATLEPLRRLASLGVRIAIDDFGTGYSNLAYLRTLPINELKFARAFVQGLRSTTTTDPADQLILTALVGLGHTLGLTVTAEGIETPLQAHRLRSIGCDTGQGFHYAAPGTADWIATVIAAGERTFPQ
jgi:EAL domain-containing protein (putative c-di-GMP-specific phosphodiesterase class I)